MSELPVLRFDGCMATNIEQAYRHLEQVYDRLVNPIGLSVLEWYTLRALYDEELLDRMEEKGLLRRQIDAVDRRCVRIFLTDRGRAYRDQVESVASQLDDLLSGLVTPEQMDAFLHVLSVLQNVDLDVPGK